MVKLSIYCWCAIRDGQRICFYTVGILRVVVQAGTNVSEERDASIFRVVPGEYVPSKRWYPPARLDGVRSQKARM